MSLMGLWRRSESTFSYMGMENPLQLIILVPAPYLESHFRIRVPLFSLARTNSSPWASPALFRSTPYQRIEKGLPESCMRRMPAKLCDEET